MKKIVNILTLSTFAVSATLAPLFINNAKQNEISYSDEQNQTEQSSYSSDENKDEGNAGSTFKVKQDHTITFTTLI